MILREISDLKTPIEETWAKLDYKNLELKNKLTEIINKKKLIHNFDEDIDEAVLHSLKYYDNLNAFVIFGMNKNDSYKYYLNHFKDEYILFGIKTMEFKKENFKKLMYQLSFLRTINNKFLEKYEPNMIQINILFVCQKDLNKNYPTTDVVNDNFYIYLPHTKEEKSISSSIFFCKNSLKIIDIQCLEHFLKKESDKSKRMFLKYRTWLLSSISIHNQSQFMLFSSVILYIIGHRQMNDLDLYIHTIPPDVIDTVTQLDKSEEYKFIEFQIKNTERWPQYWNIWLDEWAQKCGAKYFEEILGNPKYHFYFLGVKIISLECDVERRLARNRPRAVADLIALRKRYLYTVSIPDIPKISYKFVKTDGLSEIEILSFITKGGELNEKNKEIKIPFDTNIQKFLDTIVFALQTSYRIKMTVEDVKREISGQLCIRSPDTNSEVIPKKSIKITIVKKK